MKLVDAFTILLAPVLTTAFVADSTWKDRRRVEWDTKIAEVEAEVERLRLHQGHVLRTLGSRRQVQKRKPTQSRAYSTVVARPVTEDDLNETEDAVEWQWVDAELGKEDKHVDAAGESSLASSGSALQEGGDEMTAVKRLEKLVALKLAIKMLMHIRTGRSPRFKEEDPGYGFSSDDQPMHLDSLARQLRNIQRSLAELKAPAARPSIFALQILPRADQVRIDTEIQHGTDDFEMGKIFVPELVTRIGNSILHHAEPPSAKAYGPLLRVLTRGGLHDLASLVISAMNEARLTIVGKTLTVVLWRCGRNRDANQFERLLKSLSKPDANLKYAEPWDLRSVNSVMVPCPVSNDARLLRVLTYTALMCDQPHRAEAWAKILRESDPNSEATSHVLAYFMYYYASKRDWQRGRAWITTALDWTLALATDLVHDVQIVVFRILELCVACGQQELYGSILKAAVDARLGVLEPGPGMKLSMRTKNILAEWRIMHRSIETCPEDEWSAPSKARAFCGKVQSTVQSLKASETSTQFEWPTPRSTGFEFGQQRSDLHAVPDDSTSKWRDLCSQQEAELGRLRVKLADMENSTLRTTSDDARNHTAPYLAARHVYQGFLRLQLPTGNAEMVQIQQSRKQASSTTERALFTSSEPYSYRKVPLPFCEADNSTLRIPVSARSPKVDELKAMKLSSDENSPSSVRGEGLNVSILEKSTKGSTSHKQERSTEAAVRQVPGLKVRTVLMTPSKTKSASGAVSYEFPRRRVPDSFPDSTTTTAAGRSKYIGSGDDLGRRPSPATVGRADGPSATISLSICPNIATFPSDNATRHKLAIRQSDTVADATMSSNAATAKASRPCKNIRRKVRARREAAQGSDNATMVSETRREPNLRVETFEQSANASDAQGDRHSSGNQSLDHDKIHVDENHKEPYRTHIFITSERGDDDTAVTTGAKPRYSRGRKVKASIVSFQRIAESSSIRVRRVRKTTIRRVSEPTVRRVHGTTTCRSIPEVQKEDRSLRTFKLDNGTTSAIGMGPRTLRIRKVRAPSFYFKKLGKIRGLHRTTTLRNILRIRWIGGSSRKDKKADGRLVTAGVRTQTARGKKERHTQSLSKTGRVRRATTPRAILKIRWIDGPFRKDENGGKTLRRSLLDGERKDAKELDRHIEFI